MPLTKPTHPILEQLRGQREDRLRWLVGAVMTEAAAVDAHIAFVFEAIPDPEDAEAADRWRRAAWGQSGERLAEALEQSGDVWPEGPAMAVEYRRLYELRNAVAHGLHYAVPTDHPAADDDLSIESVRFVRVRKSDKEAKADVVATPQQEEDLYAVFCDLEDLRRRVIADAPPWF